MALARTADPATSWAAADEVEAIGGAQAQRDKCLRRVIHSPGMTAAEIAQAEGMDRHAPSRRLPELRKAGLVVNGEPRMCRVQRRQSLTWFSHDAKKQGKLF